MGNTPFRDKSIAAAVVTAVQSRLPSGWTGKLLPPRSGTAELRLSVRRTGDGAGTFRMEARERLEPRDIAALAAERQPSQDAPVLVAATYLSPRTQERLRSLGFAYADLAGNVRLELSNPGLFIETTGAQQNPEPVTRERSSLKGAKAGRLVRALCDGLPPIGLRELARQASVDPGYASRVVDLLDREALVTRTPRGPVTSVDWRALLQRWTQEYSPWSRGRSAMYLAPRGIPAVLDRLRATKARYAVTGSWVAAEVAPVAPPRLLTVYADQAFELERTLDLRPAEAGANVALLVPFDGVVFERTAERSGVVCVALSQVAADLLTSPGRAPNEAEALMQWMGAHEDAWRA